MEETNVIIPMAGLGKRFLDCGYKQPKPLLSLGKQTMIETVVKNLYHPSFNFTFIVNVNQIEPSELRDSLSKISPTVKFQIIETGYTPNGPAESAMLGIIETNYKKSLIITNCDQIIEDFNFDYFSNFCNTNKLDGALGVFSSYSPKNSYVRVSDNNEVIEVKEKEVISRIATNGLHWWKTGQYFIDSFEQMKSNDDKVNGEFYIAPSFNYMIKRGMKVMPYYFNLHYPIGIPADYESYKKLRNL